MPEQALNRRLLGQVSMVGTDRRIGVIGLGAMGSAIARALHAAGLGVLAWNRSPERSEAVRSAGIDCARSLPQLVAGCDTLLVCIDGYQATCELLMRPAVEDALSGKTLIQVSTGTPQEARALDARARSEGMSYLDGALLAYPEEIGASALIAVSGDPRAWQAHDALFAALSDDVRYLGESPAAAAALDLAVLSFYTCSHLGFVHGALISEAEGLDPGMLAEVLADSAQSDAQEIRKLGAALQRGEFGEPGASLGVYSGVLDRILAHARAAAISDDIPRLVDAIYKRGMAAGLADEEVVALVKLLRRPG